MLHFLDRPDIGSRLEVGILGEDVLEIGAVIEPVMLDHRSGFDYPQDLGIDLGAVEFLPRDIIERPVFHLSACSRLSPQRSSRDDWGSRLTFRPTVELLQTDDLI